MHSGHGAKASGGGDELPPPERLGEERAGRLAAQVGLLDVRVVAQFGGSPGKYQ
jgi:hypothetical protein